MTRWAYCKCCGKVIDTKNIYTKHKGYYFPCPTPGCKGKAFEIDEDMILPIMLLNKKGYDTDWCCSGHVFDIESPPDGYIAFHSKDTFPNSAPFGWYVDVSDQPEFYCIRCHNSGKNALLTRNNIQRHMNSLIHWVVNLPDNVR